MRHLAAKSITALAFILFGLAGGAVFAQPAPSAPMVFKPDAPQRYIVVEGDTLWGIAARFTDSPWRWPELWNLNKEQFASPHRIYPGNVLVLDRARNRLEVQADTTRLTPRVRSETLAQASIPSISPAMIEPFLVRPLVVESDGLDKAPAIVATEENRVIVGPGAQAYVRGIGESKEPTWFIYRQGKALVDPDTNLTLGYEAVYLGTAQLVRRGEPATIRITTAIQEISRGDRLVPAGQGEMISYAPRAPSGFVKGRIMSIYGGITQVGEAGTQSIVTLNRGKADGLAVGHVLALYRQGVTVKDVSSGSLILVPDERYGLAFVFRTFDRVSYALIMHSTRPVNPLDVVQTP